MILDVSTKDNDSMSHSYIYEEVRQYTISIRILTNYIVDTLQAD